MKQALQRFERYLQRRFPLSSTRKHYRSDLRIFVRFLGKKAPQQVTPSDVDAFVESQLSQGLSPTTINRRLVCLHCFFEFLAQESPEPEWRNPVLPRRHCLKTGSSLPRDLSDREVAQLFSFIDDVRDRALFGLMLGAGLRVGEVAALRLDGLQAVDPQSRQLVQLRVRGKGDKERIVWLTPSLWQAVQAWLRVRPAVDSQALFLNRFGRPLSVSGIQYRLKHYAQEAHVKLSCHQLRHTFARRLVENGLPVDSLARLLGHAQLATTQRYIEGADPLVRAEFARAMAQLETRLVSDQPRPSLSASVQPASSARRPARRAASVQELEKLRCKLVSLPAWLQEALEAYLRWRWPTWRAQTAYQLGQDLINGIGRIMQWLITHRQVQSWESLRRTDLEAWLQARCRQGASVASTHHSFVLLRMVLRFLEARDCPLDPGLFRVPPPKKSKTALPRYLSEGEYQRLEKTLLEATEEDSEGARLDRAWFLMLAHTGMRLSELLDLRVEDVDLVRGSALIRGSKAGRDRVVYLTEPLRAALERYLKGRPHRAEEDHVFLLGGLPIQARTLRRRLAGYGREAGVKVCPHRLRHTLATRLLNGGMPIHALRKLLGHQYLDTTQIYAQVYDETLYQQFQEAMAEVGKPWQGRLGRATWEAGAEKTQQEREMVISGVGRT